MMLRGFIAVILAFTLVKPVLAQSRAQAPRPSGESQADSCLYARTNGRWTGMPGLRRVEGSAISSRIRFAGQIGRILVDVTDFRCDEIEYEITLLSSSNEEFSSFAALLRRIERGTGNSNFSKLSAADLRALERDREFTWRNADEFGKITIETSEYTTVVRAYYSGYQ